VNLDVRKTRDKLYPVMTPFLQLAFELVIANLGHSNAFLYRVPVF
jgi:hypothetical protein